MSRGVNKVILVGHLGNEPDVRYTPTGLARAILSLATNSPTKDKQTGEWREETEWHRVVFFDRLAEFAKQFLHKGSQVYVEGRLQTRKWQDQNTGQDRYMTEIIGRELQSLDRRNESAGSYGAQSGNYSQYTQPQSGGYSTPVSPAAQGTGQPPYQPSYQQPYTEQPSPPLPPTDQGIGQPAHQPATPPPDKNFDEDVPF